MCTGSDCIFVRIVYFRDCKLSLHYNVLYVYLAYGLFHLALPRTVSQKSWRHEVCAVLHFFPWYPNMVLLMLRMCWPGVNHQTVRLGGCRCSWLIHYFVTTITSNLTATNLHCLVIWDVHICHKLCKDSMHECRHAVSSLIISHIWKPTLALSRPPLISSIKVNY